MFNKIRKIKITKRMDIIILEPTHGSNFSLIMLFQPVTM